MGKIYDALKRAEREARIIKQKQRSLNNNDIINVRELTKTKGETPLTSSDKREEKARDVQEITETAKAPKLKLIPEVTTPKKGETRRLSFLNLLRRGEKKLANKNLFVLQDPHSHVAEQYRILRTRILSSSKENNTKTILITSCLPEEGKSTVSSNLSICIANGINEHALLIDCDLRRPVIHKVFGLNNRVGLSNYLDEDIPLPHMLNKTEVEKLTILPSGNSPDNPSELLSSKKMEDLIPVSYTHLTLPTIYSV